MLSAASMQCAGWSSLDSYAMMEWLVSVGHFMRAKIIAFLVGVTAVLGMVVVTAMNILARDRDELLTRFAAERAHQLEEALTEIEKEFEAITADLRLALELAASAQSPEDRERELGALIAVVREYLGIQVHLRGVTAQRPPAADSAAPQISSLYVGLTPHPALKIALEETISAASNSPERVYASKTVEHAERWLRVFALAANEQDAVVAFVVDTTLMLSRLRIVTADPGARLLVFGAHGFPAPVSDPALIQAASALESKHRAAALPAFRALIGHLKHRDSGTLRIPPAEAKSLELGPDELIAIYRPIYFEDGMPWSTALLVSTAALSAHERAIIGRTVAILVLSVAILAALSAFVILTTRRTIALRERLRRADEVAHFHEKAEKILDIIPTGVIVLGDDDRVTQVNQVLRRRMGKVAVGGKLGDLLPEADPQSLAELESLVAAAKEGETTRSLYGESFRLFGSEGTYSLHAVPLEMRLGDARVLVVIEDLSMIGSLERQLLRSEKLATVGILAAGIAHEIGTPLAIARGRAEYMRNKLDPNDPLAQGHRIIMEQIDHVARTIRRLLDFARLDPTASAKPVDVAAVARGVADLLGMEVRRRGVELEVSMPDDLPPVDANPEQFEQVLVNLIMNACDACEPKGTIRLTATAKRSSGDTVRIEVVDDGRGIADENKNHVFDPFFTTKKRGQGTGLGLAIVSQILRNHGATVTIESEVDKGTHVVLTWPQANPKREPIEDSHRERSPDAGEGAHHHRG